MRFHKNGVRPEPYSNYVSYWCGSLWTTEEVSTYSNNLLLVFVTDNRLSGSGFMFAYVEKEGKFKITSLT